MRTRNEEDVLRLADKDCMEKNYQVLGLKEGATLDEIKKAYREISIKGHPSNIHCNAKTMRQAEEACKAYAYITEYFSEMEEKRKAIKLGFVNFLKAHISEFEEENKKEREEAERRLRDRLYDSDEEERNLLKLAHGKRFPWEDVVSSMERHLDKIRIEKECCPYCGKHIISLHFHSSQKSWDDNTGYSGLMRICVYCGKQLHFKIFEMSSI